METFFFKINPKARWGLIILAFVFIAVLDFSTPPAYILAYLYTIPILISISFLKPNIAKIMLGLAIFATLLNLIFPNNVLNIPSVVINRLLAVLAILISAFFMVRYIRYQTRIQEQEKLLATERYLAQIREDFIATLTHDLKTPLLGEEKTLQYFTEGAFGPLSKEQEEVLAALQRSNHRQLDLVENLLSAYRHDHLGVELQMTLVDLDELIADMLTEVQHLASERNITLDYICRRSPPKVQGDASQLKRVLANLIHNALNYTPAGGRIQVHLQEQPQHLLVDVLDNGPGLSEEDLENVFLRFYRTEGARHMVGTGLGLYLSRQLIKAHRGKIWAATLKTGGCKFSFKIPTVTEGNWA